MAPPGSEARRLMIGDDEAAQCAYTPGSPVSNETFGSMKRKLYVSHTCSAWNSRVFEFGAILYLAKIFPGTLLPASVYALGRGAAAAVFSPVMGRYIDSSDRLKAVRLSIVSQRLAVAVSCVVFWLLAYGWPVTEGLKLALLAVLVALACIEKLGSIANMVSVERDWVVVIAAGDEDGLREFNARMRRIDLICKFAGPFFITIIDGISTEAAILTNLAMNIVSIPMEYLLIARVYRASSALQESRASSDQADELERHASCLSVLWISSRTIAWSFARDIRAYSAHRAFLPSFSGAVLYLTVLSFSGQMVTYLVASGYTSLQIGAARTASVGFEVAATWLAPFVMSRIGPIRAGAWFINWQILCLTVATTIFLKLRNPLLAASGLVVGTILSRIGLWGFDLCVQVMVQEEVEAEIRGSFSTIEASWQNFFEICSMASTIMFSHPDQFQTPVAISCAATLLAGALFASFVRQRRGHLFHYSGCIEMDRSKPHALQASDIRALET